ncbi:hypothetical protein [Hydrogenivirga sp.]
MSAERVTWWVVFAVFSLILLSTLFGAYIAVLAVAIPEGLAFLLGLIAFLLLGNRLLFGYSNLILALEGFLSERELDRERLIKKTGEPLERVKELGVLSLLGLWLKDIDYYRYAYYGIFTLTLLLSLLTKLNLLGSLSVGNYIEGAFWGAAVVTFLIWSLDVVSHYLMGEALEREVT